MPDPEKNTEQPVGSNSVSDLDVLFVSEEGLPGRSAILKITILVGLIASISFIQFIFQLGYKLPDGTLLVSVSMTYVLSHLVRAIGLSVIAWRLFLYWAKTARLKSKTEIQEMKRQHHKLWNSIALVIFILFGYGMAMGLEFTQNAQ